LGKRLPEIRLIFRYSIADRPFQSTVLISDGLATSLRFRGAAGY